MAKPAINNKRALVLKDLAAFDKLSLQLEAVAHSIRIRAPHLTIDDCADATAAIHRSADAIANIRQATMAVRPAQTSKSKTTKAAIARTRPGPPELQKLFRLR